LMSLVLGDTDGNIRVDWLREWFIDEKLPMDLGWRPAFPSHGIVDNLKFTNMYKDLEQRLNEQDQFPIEF
jgi:hypothetical protein